jgi:hypothetical protein
MNLGAVGLTAIPLGGDSLKATSNCIGIVDGERAAFHPFRRLHAGDGEPFPKGEATLNAWQLFHAGDFKKALDAALKAGAISCANKAQAMYATYVEKSESAKQKIEAAGGSVKVVAAKRTPKQRVAELKKGQ